MRLVLFQPDIAANTGTIMRLAACMAIPIDIIEPCGFPFGDAAFRRAGLDYIWQTDCTRHDSWSSFASQCSARIVLASTTATTLYTDHKFERTDVLLFGRETSGVPAEVRDRADAAITIPQAPSTRSLNVAVAAAMILGEALRQTDGFPQQAMSSEHESRHHTRS